MYIAAARVGFALAYPLLAHWASRDGGGAAAALALADLVLVLLIEPCWRGRGWAWLLLALGLAGLYALARTPHAQTLLLAPPVLFVALVAWFFGRSLRAPREALITRIVAGLHGCVPAQLPAALYRYTRTLTAAWVVLLGLLALVNSGLALVALPDGVLAQLGHAPAWGVPREAGSLFANVLDYGVVGGFFLGEYALRRRLFPLPYRHFGEFLMQMARLGPGFWRALFR